MIGKMKLEKSALVHLS